MANTKISALPAGAPAQSTDLLPIDRAGSNFSLQVFDILNNALAYPNLSAAGIVGASYDRIFVSGSVNGDNPIYTVPSGMRAMVLVSFYNTNGSPATVIPEVNPGTGTYYRLAANLTPGTNSGTVSVYGTFVFEANDVIAYNCNVTGVNAFGVVLLFSNTSKLRTVRKFATTWVTGAQTIYTATGQNVVVAGLLMGAQGGTYINQSGSAATIASYVVQSGNTPVLGNQFQSNNNATVANNGTSGPFGEGTLLKAGDFIAFATNQTGQQALLFNVYEGV